MKLQLENTYTVKTQILGPGEGHARQVNILNRMVFWDKTSGIKYEVDPRHVEIITKQLQLDEAKVVSGPGTRDEGRTSED